MHNDKFNLLRGYFQNIIKLFAQVHSYQTDHKNEFILQHKLP